jgi:hypothetical protein
VSEDDDGAGKRPEYVAKAPDYSPTASVTILEPIDPEGVMYNGDFFKSKCSEWEVVRDDDQVANDKMLALAVG